jgi:hypothetical protein
VLGRAGDPGEVYTMSSVIHVDFPFALAGFLRRAAIFGLLTLAFPAISSAQVGKKGAPAAESSVSWNDFNGHVADDTETKNLTTQPREANCITHHGTLDGGSSLVHHNQPEEPAFGDARLFPRTTPGQVIPLGYPIAYTLGPGRTPVSGLTDASASMQLLPQGPRASCPPENQSLYYPTTPPENQE